MKSLKHILNLLVLFLSLQSIAQNRNLLIEEGTGTWCQYCPRGEVIGHELNNTYPGRVLLVAVHAGDLMEIPGLTYYNYLNFLGIPSGNLDRILNDLDPLDWQSNAVTRINLPSPVNVSLSRTYNPLTRELTVDITASLLATLPDGDYRIGGIVIEDGVTGPAPYYSQVNIYSGGANGPMGGYENLPNPVPASLMVYNHVARGLLADYSGLAGSLPPSPQQGQSYSHSFTITLDSSYREEYIKVYGFVNNAATGEILNCGTSEYAVGDFNAIPFFHSDSTALASTSTAFAMDVICHDPDDDTLFITASGLPTWLNIQPAGTHNALLSGMPASAGTYTFNLQVSDGSHSASQGMTLMVTTGGGYWTQQGQAGYSSAVSKYIVPSSIDTSTGTLYTMAVTAGHQASIYQYNGTNWSQLGGNMPSYSLASDIRVNPATGEPWIFLTDVSGNGKVLRYTGGSWLQVGNGFTADNFVQIRFSTNGTPYAAYQLNGVGIGIKSFDGTNWNALQAPINPDILGWTQMEITDEGHLVLLVAEFPPNYECYSKVFLFDGVNWSPLGSLINPTTITTPNSHSLHKLAIGPDNDIYVACAHPGGTNVYSWNGSGWDTIAVNIDNGVRKSFDIKVNSSGKVFFVYQNTNNKGTCKVWDGNAWNLVGMPDFTSMFYDVSMVINEDGNPSVTYIDLDASMGKLSTKRFINFVTGIESIISDNQKLLIYPNPAGNVIYIDNSQILHTSYSINDITGRKIQEGLLDRQFIDISGLFPGCYLLSVEGFQTMIFIKE